jgi:hypothetical protein
MPYIKLEARAPLNPRRWRGYLAPSSAGELNYQITQIVLGYLNEQTANYDTLNAIVGALESAKAEFQRRVVAPYEDRKIEENGDVY